MGGSRAWGRPLWPALVAAAALLLSAPQVFASRTASTRSELVPSPALGPPATTAALGPAYAPQGFELHATTDPHPAAFVLFPDPILPPAAVAAEKLASGVASWELTPNLQRIQVFVAESWQVREKLGPVDSPNLYQAFGLDPQNNVDPLGLEVSVARNGTIIISDVRTGKISTLTPEQVARDPQAARAAVGVAGNMDPREADALIEGYGVGNALGSQTVQAIAPSIEASGTFIAATAGGAVVTAAATLTAPPLIVAGGTATLLEAVGVGMVAGGAGSVGGLASADIERGKLSSCGDYYHTGLYGTAAGGALAIPGFYAAKALQWAAGPGTYGSLNLEPPPPLPARPALNPQTGAGYGASDDPVRIGGVWDINDLKQGLLGHPPRGLGSPDLHHGGQMPGAAKHEILPAPHRNNPVLHPNEMNQGVTPEMRQVDRQLHWWYRAREQGADQLLPGWIYDTR